MERSKIIIRTGIVGIVVNLVLVAFKATIGVLVNSIAILLDAVNNLSDALSSLITIIGTKLAGKAPDKKHPFGYGRIEYLTSVIIAAIVLAAGFTSIKESVEKIIHPEAADYTVVSLVIVAVAVVVKVVLGRYVKGVGEKINSGSLVAAGSDAFFDAVLSFATFVAAVISIWFGVSLEGILGAVISVFILKAGFEMLGETLDSIIGVRADSDYTKELKQKICSYDGVGGAYDLTLHNYGPTEIIGTVHIEVDDGMTAKEIHALSRKIAMDIYTEYGIILSVGIYASNTENPLVAEIKQKLAEQIAKNPLILQMHGFYFDEENKCVMFDLIIDFKAENPAAIRDGLVEMLAREYPDFRFDAVLDTDYSD